MRGVQPWRKWRVTLIEPRDEANHWYYNGEMLQTVALSIAAAASTQQARSSDVLNVKKPAFVFGF
jgi:hypothetical protein